MERVELVCAGCGKPGTLSRDVTVEGWEAVNIYRQPDGSMVEETTGERDADWFFVEPNGYSCSECQGSWAQLADAAVNPEYDCPKCKGGGCPRCMYSGRESEPPPLHPGQIDLEAALRDAV